MSLDSFSLALIIAGNSKKETNNNINIFILDSLTKIFVDISFSLARRQMQTGLFDYFQYLILKKMNVEKDM